MFRNIKPKRFIDLVTDLPIHATEEILRSGLVGKRYVSGNRWRELKFQYVDKLGYLTKLTGAELDAAIAQGSVISGDQWRKTRAEMDSEESKRKKIPFDTYVDELTGLLPVDPASKPKLFTLEEMQEKKRTGEWISARVFYNKTCLSKQNSHSAAFKQLFVYPENGAPCTLIGSALIDAINKQVVIHENNYHKKKKKNSRNTTPPGTPGALSCAKRTSADSPLLEDEQLTKKTTLTPLLGRANLGAPHQTALATETLPPISAVLARPIQSNILAPLLFCPAAPEQRVDPSEPCADMFDLPELVDVSDFPQSYKN